MRPLLLPALGALFLAACAAAPAGSPGGAVDLLVFAPHPDDEALGCAGLLRRAVAEGRRVKVVFFTNGDGFPAFASRLARRPPDALTPQDFLELARYRQEQARTAFAALGGNPDDLIFLGYPDAGLDPVYRRRDDVPFTQPLTRRDRTYGALRPDYHSAVHGRPAPYTYAAALADVVELIRTLNPREILVTNEADTHPDHKAAFWFVRDALKPAAFQGSVLTYLIHGGPEWPWPKGATPEAPLEVHDVKGRPSPAGVPWPPPHRVTLTREEAESKRRAIAAHATHLAGVTDRVLVEEREYLESFIKSEEVYWPFPAK